MFCAVEGAAAKNDQDSAAVQNSAGDANIVWVSLIS
jgi:hypothetical protein